MFIAITFSVLVISLVVTINVEHRRFRDAMSQAERVADDAEWAAFAQEL